MGLNILHYYNKTKFKTSYQTTSKVFKKRFLVGNNPIENMAHVVKEEHTEIGITIGITCKSKMQIMKRMEEYTSAIQLDREKWKF